MNLIRRLALLFALITLLLLVGAAIYQAGMAEFEGEERSFLRSLEWSAETLTTTGYGSDEQWSHPMMVLFVIVYQFLGVFVVFLIVPLYLIPYLESRFETRLPTSMSALTNHLVIYGWGSAVASIMAQAEEKGLKVVVIEESEVQARRLVDRGLRVVHSRLEDGALEAAHLNKARALIANSTDERDAAVVLAARQAGFEGEIMALAEEPFHRQPLVLAGADVVFTPRHAVGASLAARASDRISPPVSGPQRIGSLQVRQIRIRPTSSLAGQSLEESGIGARTGATVIGQWVGGRLQANPTAATQLEANGILVVVGTDESVASISDLCEGVVPLPQEGPLVVAGFGEVGQKVVELLSDVDEDVQVVDRLPVEGVDVVGDLLDPKTLEVLRLDEARAMILALESDSATLFAAVVIRDRYPELPIIARVNEAENVDRIHRAGADFALSVSLVSGQILARRLFGEEAVSIDTHLKVLKSSADRLGGTALGRMKVREKTGCSIIAVERAEKVLTNLGPDFVFADGDCLYLCGSESALGSFADLFNSG